MNTRFFVAFLLSSIHASGLLMVEALVPASKFYSSCARSVPLVRLNNGASGGWGIGNSREMTPEEFARGDRRAFEGYQLRDRGEFMRKVQQDKEDMKMSEMDELLGVAASAGIRVKDPSERLNRFDSSVFDDEDDDDIDLSVPDDDVDVKVQQKKDSESITRMDEDTGAMGEW